ncbi:MAG: PAS domain S-box protein [Spirochaetota bacterium]
MFRPSSEQTGPRILLVEDERIVALSEQRTLERYGYAVTTAPSGEEAVARVREDEGIDLVLMDIDLGDGMDGTEAAARLLELRELPVVFLTGHAEREMVDRVKGITRYGYVLKTAGEFVLVQAIEMAFELFESRREAVAAAERYRSVSNLTGEIIVQHDAEGRWTFLNDRACEFWGGTREELLGRVFHDFVHPDDVPAECRVMERLAGNERAVRGHLNRQKTPDGWRVVEWNSEIIRDPGGRAVGYQATGRDVTDRIDLERSLTYHRDLLQKIMYTTPTSILVLAADGTITHVNRRAGEVLGVDPAEVEGLHRDHLPWLLEWREGEPVRMDEGPFSTVRRTGRPVFNLEYTLRRPDGDVRLVEISSAPLLSGDGSFDGTVAVLEDVTDRVQARQQIAQREARFRALFEQSPYGIILADAESRIVDVNPRAVEMLGYTREELLTMDAHDLIPEDSLAERPLARTLAEAAEGRRFVEIDGRYRRKDGSLMSVIVRVRKLGEVNDNADYMVTFNDVTARREAEERIRKLLDEKELLIREIHHRVKNDLNLVQSLASLQKRHSSHEETKTALDEMINRLAVMSRVYDGLRAGHDLQRVELDELLTTLVDGLRRTTLPAGVEIELEAPRVLVLQVVSVAIGIMVNELVTNAVRHGLADARRGRITVRATVADGTVEVVVADSGAGFPPEFLREPVFGYGLTIVDALARQHDGRLELGNTDGAWARVAIPLGD